MRRDISSCIKSLLNKSICIKKTPPFLLLFFLYLNSEIIADIRVTSIEIEDGRVAVLINNSLKLRDVRIEESTVKFPVYKTHSGENIENVRFLKSCVQNSLKSSILSGKVDSPACSDTINFRIVSMVPSQNKDSYVRARASVVFNELIEVDCSIMQTSQKEGDYWISWPARPPSHSKGENGWINQFIITDRKLRTLVEKELVDTYIKNKIKEKDSERVVGENSKRAPMAVTYVKVEEVSNHGDFFAVADIDLNDAFRISGIRVYEIRDRVFLDYPPHALEGERGQDRMRVFSKRLKRQMRRAVETGNPSGKIFRDVFFEITGFEKFKGTGDIKYAASVTLNGVVEIDCLVIDGEGYEAFVSWPSEKRGGDYYDIIYPSDREVKKKIEDAVLCMYREEL